MRPFCIGLTGGIGAGKSTVAQCFASRGVAVVDTDAIARDLTSAKGAALDAIVEEFGAGCLDGTGALDRQAMRGRVFSDPSARGRLERILHPLIRAEAAKRLYQEGASPAKGRYVVLVVPLLAERLDEYRHLVDRIAVVDCDEAQQLQRIMDRPGMSEAQARSILAAQSSRARRLAIADDVIDNRGDLTALAQQVSALHGRYSRLAEEKSPAGPTTRCTS